MPSIGPLELGIVLLVALLVLGPQRLPAAGRSLGRGIREFKTGLTPTTAEGRTGVHDASVDAPTGQRSAT